MTTEAPRAFDRRYGAGRSLAEYLAEQTPEAPTSPPAGLDVDDEYLFEDRPEDAGRVIPSQTGRRQMIPTFEQSDLLRRAETLFAFGACRLCGDDIPSESGRIEHLDMHRRLQVENRKRLEQLDAQKRAEVEAAMGTHMRRIFGSPPKPDKLARHIKLYGTDGVLETVRDWAPTGWKPPISVYRTDAPSGRRMTFELRQTIGALREQGTPASAIANVLNLTQRRVREVLAG